MRLRPGIWPAWILLPLLGLGSWALDVAEGPPQGPDAMWWTPASDAAALFGAIMAVILVGRRLAAVQLRPEGLQRGSRSKPFLLPWSRIQAVAVSGDTDGPCPTLWADDGRVIMLDELSAEFGVGGQTARRNCARIRDTWIVHRGLSWQPAPWAAALVPGWVPGSAAAPAAGSPAAVTSRLRAAWYVWAAYLTVPSAVAGIAVFSRVGGDGWRWRTEFNVGVAMVAVLFAIWVCSGARLSAHGIGCGRGALQIGWPRVQAVTITGGLWFARPTVVADDGQVFKFHDLGVLLGVGRTRACEMRERIEQTWLILRGPAWHPLPPPAPDPMHFPPRPDVNYWAPPAS